MHNSAKSGVSRTGCLAALAILIASIFFGVIAEKFFPESGAAIASLFFLAVYGYCWETQRELDGRLKFIEWIRNDYPALSEEAAKGDAGLQYDLGWKIWERDLKKEFIPPSYWYLKAAEQGHVKAQEALAAYYRWGHDAPVDLEKSAYWYHKAADQGAIHAQLQMGIFCFNGWGVPKDYTQAAAWYRKASLHPPGRWNNNHYSPDAQRRLGACYYFGWGVAKDDVEAYAYYELGGRKDEADRRTFSNLEKLLTSGGIEAGKRRAADLRKEIASAG